MQRKLIRLSRRYVTALQKHIPLNSAPQCLPCNGGVERTQRVLKNALPLQLLTNPRRAPVDCSVDRA